MTMDLRDFLDRYGDEFHGTKFKFLEHFLQHCEHGRGVSLYSSPRNGRTRLAVDMGAFWEATMRNWDVVGGTPEARQDVRRRARELAARVTR